MKLRTIVSALAVAACASTTAHADPVYSAGYGAPNSFAPCAIASA